MKSRKTTLFLFISGLLLLAIGAGILLAPHAFHSSNGIVFGSDPNTLSEIRAPGGLLAFSAILILIGAVRSRLRSLSLLLVVLVYGSFGLARLLSILLDGMPSEGIVGAMIIELIVAAIGTAIMYRRSVVSGFAYELAIPSEAQ